MKFNIIYSKRGKQIFPRAGMIISAGSQVLLDDNTWITLNADHMIGVEVEDGNPYDQYSRDNKTLVLKELS